MQLKQQSCCISYFRTGYLWKKHQRPNNTH